MNQADTVKSKMVEMLPMLADFAKNEEALHAVLMGLYDAGVTDGKAQMNQALDRAAADISAVVGAHARRDVPALVAALDSIVARCYPEFGIKPSGLH